MFCDTSNIKAGDFVNCVYGDRCEVVKVNNKSVVIVSRNGGRINLEKKLIIRHYPA